MCDQQKLRPGQFSLMSCLVLMTIISCVLGYIQLAGVTGLLLAIFPPLLIGGLVNGMISMPDSAMRENGTREYDHSKSGNAGLLSLVIGYAVWIPIHIAWYLATLH